MSSDLVVTNDEEILAFTQGKRHDLVRKLTANGAPGDTDDQRVLLQTLDGMDRVALTRLKIQADERASNKQTNAAALIASVLMHSDTKNAYQFSNGVARDIPVLGEEIPPPTVVDGELDHKPEQLDYDTFMTQRSSTPNAD